MRGSMPELKAKIRSGVAKFCTATAMKLESPLKMALRI
jgi:hypothetical protein